MFTPTRLKTLIDVQLCRFRPGMYTKSSTSKYRPSIQIEHRIANTALIIPKFRSNIFVNGRIYNSTIVLLSIMNHGDLIRNYVVLKYSGGLSVHSNMVLACYLRTFPLKNIKFAFKKTGR